MSAEGSTPSSSTVEELLRSRQAQKRTARRTQLALAGLGAVVVAAHVFGQWALVASEEIDLVASASAVAAAVVMASRQ